MIQRSHFSPASIGPAHTSLPQNCLSLISSISPARCLTKQPSHSPLRKSRTYSYFGLPLSPHRVSHQVAQRPAHWEDSSWLLTFRPPPEWHCNSAAIQAQLAHVSAQLFPPLSLVLTEPSWPHAATSVSRGKVTHATTADMRVWATYSSNVLVSPGLPAPTRRCPTAISF